MNQVKIAKPSNTTHMETNKKVKKNLRFDSYPAPLEQVSAYTRKYSGSAEIKGYHFTQLVVSLLLKWVQGLFLGKWPTAWVPVSAICFIS